MSRLILLALILTFTASAQTKWTSARPDGHAPIGVMGDHTHEKGEVMLSYRLMHMGMEGSRVDSDTIENSEIVSPTGSDFLVTPLNMPTQMHMIGGMYAPTDRVTLMGMVNILSSTMDHQTRPGGMFTTESKGMGDTSLSALVLLADSKRQRVHLTLGASLPTGSIEQQDVTPASAPNQARLPYPMQLGSGTFDFLPGITYLAESDRWSGGAQVGGTVRTGENDSNYRLGNRFQATGWAARKLSDRVSASVRLTSENWGNIEGADESFAGPVVMRMVPTVFPDLRGGNRIDIGAGLNTYLKRSRPGQIRLALEVSRPIFQRLDGPQLETDYQVMFGTQFLF
jgi:hypothetical protein